jgi:multisubunit Na+/H+ antiporter MnhE subunit
MIGFNHFSWLYVAFGIVGSAVISLISFRLKLIEEKSELLYLSLGFYRHFLKIFFGNFFDSLKIILKIALQKQPFLPKTYVVKIDEKNHLNPAALLASFNMMAGIIPIGFKDNKILLHAIDEQHFQKINLPQLFKSLCNANDDNLV